MSRLKLRIQNPNSPFGHHPEKNLTTKWLENKSFYPEEMGQGHMHYGVCGSGWNNLNQEEEEEEDEEKDPEEYESNN